jgi:hypothetical protein
MVAKISPRHRAAFIEALAETGNYALAADQVRVSRDWAFRLRRREPAFDAACREAVETFRASVRGSSPPLPNPSPAMGRGASGGAALVVQRGRGRRVQVKRARASQWTHETEQHFLAALAGSCNVKLSAAEAGKSAHSAYYRRRTDPGFARAWDAAVEIGMCELESQMHENIGHFFDRELPEPKAPMRDVSVMDAIRLVRMYGRRRRRA